jgi:arylsulfatase A-like enzyme
MSPVLPVAARLALLAGAVFLAGLVSPPSASAAIEPPNVLIIVTDDQRVGTLGVMPRTVRFFQRQGRTFTRGFVTTPLCCPSRASIFTGRYAHNHGVETNGDGRLLPQDVTLQRYLADAGYTTAIVGKYLNSWPLHRDPPHFDHWALAESDTYRDPEFNVDGTLKTLRGYATDVLASRAVRVLRRFEATDSQPWFLYVAPVAPHLPSMPAPEYANAPVPAWRPNPAVREADRADKPPWVRERSISQAWVRPRRADQFRTLMSVDDLVSRVARTLGDLRERRRTIAFFVSDNGFLWGEHGLAFKGQPYTHSIKIPLLLTWPGHVSPGSRDGRHAATIDIAPTILDAVGITPAEPMDGKSLLQTWTRRHLFTEYYRTRHHYWIRGWASVRTRRMQYVEYYDDEDRSHVVFREYYRLDRDPWQLTNVLRDGNPANNPDIRRLHQLVKQYRACSASSCP